MPHSKRRRAAAKPTSFPLFKHQSGRWCKKVRRKHVYFGSIEKDPDGSAALNLWLDQRDDLLAGRTPREKGDGLTVRLLVNTFLTSKESLVESGELASRTFDDYFATGTRLGDTLGRDRLVADLAAEDFEALRAKLAKKWGPVSLGNEINRVRVIFKYAYDSGLIDRPVRYGAGFNRPSKKTLRLDRHAKGERFLEAAQLRKVLEAAETPLRAMILLGLNCGFGNADVGNMPLAAVNLKTRWVVFPRPKTGIARRAPLWPETCLALREAIKARPSPKHASDASLVFVTKYGSSWAKESRDNPVSKEFAKLLKELGLHRKGLGFYLLRHVFETVGGEAKDQVAVNAIMGHADASMAATYRERISDARLKAVVEHVRRWLFPPRKKMLRARRPK